ncbi:MAG: dephospho-CoA kinase [Janthinobacterium lividum]
MLRVGLTGELGSGKSTVARLFAEQGATVMSSDEMGRAMMQPGEAVFYAIVEQFGPAVLSPEGSLDRRELARLAFNPQEPRVEELNAIVHPAVFAEQERRVAEIAREQPEAIVVIESALIFNTKHAGGQEPWRSRFDEIVVVTAPEELKLQRFVARSTANQQLPATAIEELLADAKRRLAAQSLPAEATAGCLVIRNEGTLEDLKEQVGHAWLLLEVAADGRKEG